MSLPPLMRRSIDGIPAWRFALRVLLVTVELMLFLWLGQQGTLFFYQGF